MNIFLSFNVSSPPQNKKVFTKKMTNNIDRESKSCLNIDSNEVLITTHPYK